MTEPASLGLFAVLAAVVAVVLRALMPKTGRKGTAKAPQQAAARQARETIRKDGEREVTEVIAELDQPNALQRLVNRANRRRGR